MKVTDTSQPNNKDDDRVKKSMKQKNSPASNLKALKDDCADSEMAQMMSKLLRQQAAPEVDIDVFTGDPTKYHYFLAVFEEVVEKKIDDARVRLTRLIKYTSGEPKEMIKHCIQQPANIGYKNARPLLEQKYGNPHSIIAEGRSKHGHNSNQLMVLPFKNSTTFLSNVKVQLMGKHGVLLIHQK